MSARRFFMLGSTVSALLLGALAGAGPVLAAPCDTSGVELDNGGFESPAVAADSYTLFPAASVVPWETTDGSDEIEIWGDGFLGVPAYEGNAFAELNANTAGTLYQDVVTTPGSTMTWVVAHRGRDGDDVMQVLIGDANTADVMGTTGWDYTSLDLTDGNVDWGTHTDDYVVPTGQTCTRFAFRAVSSVGGASYGNLLDAVSFVVTAAAPPAPTAVVVITPPPTDVRSPDPAATDTGAVLPGSLLLLGIGSVLGLATWRARRGHTG